MDAEWPIEGRLDAIFCRNVMIYFDKPTQRRLVERFAALIKPKGLFFAGHAESLIDQGVHFRLRGQTVTSRPSIGHSASIRFRRRNSTWAASSRRTRLALEAPGPAQGWRSGSRARRACATDSPLRQAPAPGLMDADGRDPARSSAAT